VSEGTGFYAWRIRRISDYHGGGLANPLNRGAWSYPHEGGTVDLRIDANTQPEAPFFFFTDPDDNRNWNFSRTFTEGGRIKESVTYADALHRERQTTVYLPSGNVSVVTQTVPDHTGRPALVTLPVPVEGKRMSYLEQLVKEKTSGELFTAKHFDSDATVLNPPAVDETGAFAYYKSNPDNVADAEGYPYMRTVYYNDGTGRVREQGNAGATLKTGGGHTTKYFYETASQSELNLLFGNEAPNAERVFKAITVDPNGVATVNYTNSEGQVIASGLTLSENTSMKAVDDESTINMEVSNRVTANTGTGYGFVSSKRITLLTPTAVGISYSVDNKTIDDLCVSTEIDCRYMVRIKIIRTADDNTSETVFNTEFDLADAASVGNRKVIANAFAGTLAKGTYIVQKELRSTGQQAFLSQRGDVIASQVNPITETIADWLSNVADVSQLESFFRDLEDFALSINRGTLHSDYGLFDAAFYELHKNDYRLNLYKNDQNRINLAVLSTPCCRDMEIPILWTPPFDCESAKPDFEGFALDVLGECIRDESLYGSMSASDIFYGVYMAGWKPGWFNEMVYQMLHSEYKTGKGNDAADAAKVQYECEALWECWAGVVNMLLQQTQCAVVHAEQGSSNESISSQYDGEYAGDDSSGKYAKDHDTHFDSGFKGGFFLIKWIAKRKMSKRMRELKVGNSSEEGFHVSTAIDIHLVKEFLSCTGYRFAKMLTYYDASPLPEDRAAGFAYLKSSAQPPHPYIFNTVTDLSAYKRSDGTHPYVPVAGWDKNYTGERVTDKNTGKPLFPSTANPVYAFKYFYYEGPGNTLYQALESDVCLVDPNDCFEMENGFYKTDAATGKYITVPCCGTDNCVTDTNYPATPGKSKQVVDNFCGKGRIRCPEYYESWNAGQRYSFFEMISSTVPQEAAEWKAESQTSCSDYIGQQEWMQNGDGAVVPKHIWISEYGSSNAFTPVFFDRINRTTGETERLAVFRMVEKELQEFMTQCHNECNSKRADIKAKIIDLLLNNCWEIGECRTDNPATFNVIPEDDIDMLVERAIEECHGQCDKADRAASFACDDIPCRTLDTPYSDIGNNHNVILLQYGVGNHPDGRDSGFSSTVLSGTAIRNYSGQPLAGISWYSHTLYKQIAQWQLDFWIESRCNAGSSEPPGATDTWLPREAYHRETGGIVDPDAIKEVQPVFSPYKKVEGTTAP
jgi:hypothetical protein